MPAPRTTSLAQCLLWYMRESPTIVAPPYITGATNFTAFGWRRRTSLVTDEATANAVVVCPDGNDWRSALPNPPPILKSVGFVSLVTNGRARPIVPFRKLVMAVARRTD